MCRTPASILPSAALGPLRTWRGLCFASFKRCAGSSVVRTYLSPVGRAPTLCASVASSVLGAPASIIGSELSVYWAPAFRSAYPDKTCSCQDDQGRGILRGVPAHDFGEEEHGDRRTSPRHRHGERGRLGSGARELLLYRG